MATRKQIQANRQNSKKSTGPKTRAGKANSSGNSVAHGLLGRELIIPGENREEYQAMFEQLVSEFEPFGLLETTLVERIAVAIWRQRRLIRVESARVTMRGAGSSSLDADTVKCRFGTIFSPTLVEQEMSFAGLVFLQDKAFPDPFWQTFLDGLNVAIDDEAFASLSQLEFRHPDTFMRVMDYLGFEPSQAADEIMDAYDSLQDCLEQTRDDVQLRVGLQRAIELYRSSHSWPENPLLIARYQSSLDNELYKAIRALRDLQDWRRKTREQEVIPAQPVDPS